MQMYKSIFNFLSDPSVLVQQAQTESFVLEQPVVRLSVDTDKVVTLKHSLGTIDQKIYLHLNENSQCFFNASDHLKQLDRKAVKVEFHILLEDSSTLQMMFQSIQLESINCNINVYLKGDKSNASIKGLYALSKEENITLQTYQYHEGSDTNSKLQIKGMLKDKAKASYQGLIKIDKDAAGTDAAQEHKNIVLSKDAKVVSVPSIEVLQHDVACCHGTAIGKFRPQDIWYLQSKGIEKKEAYKLLMQSFFQDVVIDLDQKNKIMELVWQKLG